MHHRHKATLPALPSNRVHKLRAEGKSNFVSRSLSQLPNNPSIEIFDPSTLCSTQNARGNRTHLSHEDNEPCAGIVVPGAFPHEQQHVNSRSEKSREVLENYLRFQPLQPRPHGPQVPVGVVGLRPSQKRLLAQLGERCRVRALVSVQIPEDLPDPVGLQLREDTIQVGRLLLPKL